MSSELSEEQVRTILMDSNIRRIARYCEVPHTSEEIISMLAYPSPSQDWHESSVSQGLNLLESKGAITFTDKKWKTNPKVMAVLQKYFGAK